ncbi:MAG: hypothetical protein WAL85_13540 [Candidatus Korobacteraceae bacterium]
MKLGTDNKRKTIIAGVLVVVAAALLVHTFMGGNEDTAAPAPATAAQHSASQTVHKTPHALLAHSLDPSLRFDLLKSSEDITYKGTGRNIFRSEAPPPEIPTPLPADQQPKPVYTPPPPPPIDLKFYGFAGPKGGSKRIFLLKGEDIFLAKEGDIVDRRYKIMRISPNSVEVQDVLTNNTQTLPLSAG